MHIKIFGIQRTGTNYLGFLLGNNIIVKDTIVTLNDVAYSGQDKPGWKHGAVPHVLDIEETLRQSASNIAVIIIKNPYTWYTSILKWIGRAEHGFDGFSGQDPEHVFIRYNSLYEDHRKFLLGEKKNTVYRDGVLIRYEDLVLDPKKEVIGFADKFNLTVKDKFTNTNKIVQSQVFTEKRRAYYLAQKPDYSADIVERVNDAVDWELMRFYGYEKI